jgi:hypothetical protein
MGKEDKGDFKGQAENVWIQLIKWKAGVGVREVEIIKILG